MFTSFFFRSSMILKSVSISALLIPVVGSSRRRIFALIERALMISTILFWPSPKSPTKARGSTAIAKEERYFAALSISSLFLMEPKKDVVGSWPRKMFSATVRESTRLSS